MQWDGHPTQSTAAAYWSALAVPAARSIWSAEACLSGRHLFSSESVQAVSLCVFSTHQDRRYDQEVRFWTGCVSGNTLLCFLTLHAFLEANCVIMGEHVKKSHNLNQLAKHPTKIPPLDTSETWIRILFEASLPIRQLSFQEQEQLLELSSDGALQLQFKQKPLVDSWTKAMPTYPVLAKQANVVVIIATICYWEYSHISLSPPPSLLQQAEPAALHAKILKWTLFIHICSISEPLPLPHSLIFTWFTMFK